MHLHKMVTINRKVWLLRICGSSGFVSVSRTAANSLSMSPRSFLNCKNSSVLSTEAVHELWVAPPQCSDFTSDRIKRQLKWTFMQRSRGCEAVWSIQQMELLLVWHFPGMWCGLSCWWGYTRALCVSRSSGRLGGGSRRPCSRCWTCAGLSQYCRCSGGMDGSPPSHHSWQCQWSWGSTPGREGP